MLATSIHSKLNAPTKPPIAAEMQPPLPKHYRLREKIVMERKMCLIARLG